MNQQSKQLKWSTRTREKKKKGQPDHGRPAEFTVLLYEQTPVHKLKGPTGRQALEMIAAIWNTQNYRPTFPEPNQCRADLEAGDVPTWAEKNRD